MITFLNHACVKINHNNINLIMDPYISGSAFNNGWNLITEENHEKELEEISHIWFSHEHPDHFSVNFLKSIPEDKRNDITILFQFTLDKRVISFCKKLGFKTFELKEGSDHYLEKDFKIICGKIPYYDSWLYIEYGGKRIINCNDCILENPNAVMNVKRYIAHVDILLTQFSYANWYGNEEDKSLRSFLANEKLDRIKLQSDAFKAKFIIPFASFIFFSHEENFYMNEEINNLDIVNEYVTNNCRAYPIILKPNERWDGFTKKDNKISLEYWRHKYSLINEKKLNTSEIAHKPEEIINRSKKFIERIKQKNNMFLVRLLEIIGIIKPVIFLISDQNVQMRFTWKNGLQIEKKLTDISNRIELHSESVVFLFDYDFGLDTLNVNARFNSSVKTKRNMIRTFFIPSLNNTGRYFTVRSLLTSMNINFIINGLKTVGLIKKRDIELE